uniref:Udp-gal glucosylceramide beta-1,4-galactosyltransferase n=1 Tax=Rhipicephalus zambeziensis TaxID=60191 RepID=A0A224ZBB4_9ACAR
MKKPVTAGLYGPFTGSRMSAVLRVMARSLIFKLTAGCALMYVLVIVCLDMSGYKETVFKAMFQGSIVVYRKAAAAERQTTPTWNQSHAVTGVPEDVLRDSLRANISYPEMCPPVSPNLTIASTLRALSRRGRHPCATCLFELVHRRVEPDHAQKIINLE